MDFAPMITVVTKDLAKSQAKATCATEILRASAIGRMASTHLKARGLSTTGKSNVARRAPAGPLSSALLNLPLSKPPAKGLHTINPHFYSWLRGTVAP